MDNHYTILEREIRKSIKRILSRYGVSDSLCEKIFSELVSELSVKLHGRKLYFGKRGKLNQRDKSIYSLYMMGENTHEIAKIYGLSQRMVYRIIKEVERWEN